jgi:hypothetical protein
MGHTNQIAPISPMIWVGFIWRPKPPLMLASPNMEAKVPTFEPQETVKTWLIIIKGRSRSFDAKVFAVFVLGVGSNFLFNPTFNTNPKPHLQKMLPCKHRCHTWDLGHKTPCEVVGPNFHSFNG